MSKFNFGLCVEDLNFPQTCYPKQVQILDYYENQFGINEDCLYDPKHLCGRTLTASSFCHLKIKDLPLYFFYMPLSAASNSDCGKSLQFSDASMETQIYNFGTVDFSAI